MIQYLIPRIADSITLTAYLQDATTGKTTRTKFALWDTGASMSAVCKDLADWLGLKVVRQEYMESASETRLTDVCKCRIILPDGSCFDQEVFVLPKNDTPAIIGFDIISQGRFILDEKDEANLVFNFKPFKE